MRKIVTSYVNPPIPYRQNDWCAHYDGEEEAGNYGWGSTEEEAIRDFIYNCKEDHDERLCEQKMTPTKRPRGRPKSITDMAAYKAAKQREYRAKWKGRE